MILLYYIYIGETGVLPKPTQYCPSVLLKETAQITNIEYFLLKGFFLSFLLSYGHQSYITIIM
jgi:hypothetical protein